MKTVTITCAPDFYLFAEDRAATTIAIRPMTTAAAQDLVARVQADAPWASRCVVVPRAGIEPLLASLRGAGFVLGSIGV